MKNLLIILVLMIPVHAHADSKCVGRFVNPITDICWSCILPISIGNISIGKGSKPKKRDIKNPSSPLCICIKNKIPIPGISIGFWEPTRLVDITRTPYCMVNLDGMKIRDEIAKTSSPARGYGDRRVHGSFYHLHYYAYPLIYWLELLTDFACLETGTFDVAYLSELDITWNDEKMQTLINPEALLFGNPIAQIACGLDCAASTIKSPLDSLFWCAGCWGNMYPLSGANADHIGGVQSSSLLVARLINKMHRIGLARVTSTNSSKLNGAICKKRVGLKIKKSQYKLQLLYPKSSSEGLGCWPLGFSTLGYAAGNEYPYDGEDWGYLIWRKKNCCLF